jgi:hypothetical protein
MLDIMRKHASSWGIKAVLSMIIVSFVLFFGYSRIARIQQPSIRGGGNQASVAFVNRMAIPESEYRFYYDNAIDRLRAQYQGQPVPEFMREMIEQSTLAQLIRRELMLQVADELGITITDEQLARAIRRNQEALRGEFDPTFYTHQYLPYFENRFGINYEDMLRNDLRADEVRKLFASPPPKGDEAAEAQPEPVVSWSLEVVTLDVDAMIKEGTASSQEDAHTIAQQFIDNVSAGQWKRMARKYDAKVDAIEAVTLRDRRSKLPGYTFDHYRSIFALTENAPVVDEPMTRPDNTIAVVRLTELKETEGKATPPRDEFFQQWMSQMAARSKIRTFLDQKNQARK